MQKTIENEKARLNKMSWLGDFTMANDIELIKKQLIIAVKALDEIADPTSAFHTMGRPRNLSYADWELRAIARVALDQITESRPQSTSDKN